MIWGSELFQRTIRYLLLFGWPFLIYVLLVWYKPLRNATFLDFPEPTVFSRPPEAIDLLSFGAPIRAGFAKADITPPLLSSLAGYDPYHPALFVHDRLWVKSLALEDQRGHRLVVVSVDLIGFLPDEIDRILDLIQRVPREVVFISATHTHSGPDTIGLWGIRPFTGKNQKYLSFLRKQIAAAIDDSVLLLSPSLIRFGSGELRGFSHGREENPADPLVSVLQVLKSSLYASGSGGWVPITLVNFGVHADTVKSLAISTDFPFYLERRLQLLIGGEIMFIPAVIGGVQPTSEESELQFSRTLGEQLGDAAWQALQNPIIPLEANIDIRKRTILAPLQNSRFWWIARFGTISQITDWNDQIRAEISQIRIGPAEILTVPGELFPKIWQNVKLKMRGSPKFIFGLTNGELGYILLPEDFVSQKHPYHVSMSIGPDLGVEVDRALRELAGDHN